MPIRVSAFYTFVRLDDAADLRSRLFAALAALDIRGTILIATEGINGTISGTPAALERFFTHLRSDPRFSDLSTKDTRTPVHPFKRLKVKLKKEILTLRRPEADPSVRVGTYVAPKDWNALLASPDVLVVDTRNRYEVEAGTFPGAVDPDTRCFADFPAFVSQRLDPTSHKKIAMFCTGGIRCEKASAYLLAHGFDEVFHLQGGILAYLDQVPHIESTWQGTCFVFDERETIGEPGRPAMTAAAEACDAGIDGDETGT